MGQMIDLPANPAEFRMAFGGRTASYKMWKYLSRIEHALEKNKVVSVDTMEYSTDPLAAAGWVSSDTVATTGVVCTSEAVNMAAGTYALLMTTGSSTFSADVNVTKTLTTSTFEDDLGSQDWRDTNYIGFVIYAGAATAATDIDLKIGDIHGNWATIDVPAVDSNHATVHVPIDLAFSGFTGAIDWQHVKYVRLTLTSTMGTSETVVIDEMIRYKYSNGFGPAKGTLVKFVGGEASITRAMHMKPLQAGLEFTVVSSNDGDEETFGISCSDGDAGDEILVQVDGLALVEFGALTSLEIGDGMETADAAGLTVQQAAATMATAWCKYIGPLVAGASAAQYGYGWAQIGAVGATPS